MSSCLPNHSGAPAVKAGMEMRVHVLKWVTFDLFCRVDSIEVLV
jgi:hypothetical protein